MFELTSLAPSDPILGLADLFNVDKRPNKINLGIGIYKTENNDTPILKSVKKAEQYLLANEITKNYLSIDGLPSFIECTKRILFG
ncbi:MAG: aminotransferase class I/II-fold pyridoxal phosphate-dependent enzyme, partial [Pantoea sp. Brub]|nr:aminotransferase class I/II-fold pyridoxal phosphate-dependent enzyme [Pantoea sp. Brub]